MNNILKLRYVAIFILITFFTSCEKNEIVPILPIGSEGFFIVNEGTFNAGNASLSFFSRSTGEVTNNLYYYANNESFLGDQAQSMSIVDSTGYIMVQNSGLIKIINTNNYDSLGVIDDGIESPRYFTALSSTKAYVSDWGVHGITGTVKVLDLTTKKVTKSITTGQGTNNLLIVGDKLFAVNAGGLGRDNTMVIIDTKTDEVTKKITLTDNPNSLQLDANNNIWVLSSGYTAYDENWEEDPANSTFGALTKLNTDGEIITTLAFSKLNSPSLLNISKDGKTLLFQYDNGVYSMAIADTALPTTALIEKTYYGLAVDPFDGSIIGCEATGYITDGNIDVYTIQGELKKSYKVGILPNGCAFK